MSTQLPLFGAPNRMRREATKSTREIKLQFSIAAAIEESSKDQVKKMVVPVIRMLARIYESTSMHICNAMNTTIKLR